MKQLQIGPGALNDVVQETIARLESGRELVGHIAGTARSQFDLLSREMEAARDQLDEVALQYQGWKHEADTAQRHLQELVHGSTHATEIIAAVNQLVEAKVRLATAEQREQHLLALVDRLTPRVVDLRRMAEQGQQLADDLSSSVGLLATQIRDLGSHLESAQQGRALGLHVIRAQEEERRRLAREIHDGPTQLLNSVVLRIDVCQRFFESDLDRARMELQQLKDLVRLSLQEVRKIIFDLRPMTLDDLGIVPALRAFLKDYQGKTGIETDFSAFGSERRYDSAFEIAIFRIVQEALTNVSKHAGASRVWVKVEAVTGREVKVAVRDDGAGFEPDRIVRGPGGTKFGLVAMRERTELLGGMMDIHSTPGQGAKLLFVFPIAD